MLGFKVAVDNWDEGRGWKWESVSLLVPSTTLLKLAPMVLNPSPEAIDKMGWLEAVRGTFTVRSAYGLANGWIEEGTWEG